MKLDMVLSVYINEHTLKTASLFHLNEKTVSSSYEKKEYTYFNYAEEQAKLIESDAYRKRTEYWNNVRQEYISELDLPYSFAKGNKLTREGGKLNFDMDQNMSSQINSFCKRNKISPFSKNFFDCILFSSV